MALSAKEAIKQNPEITVGEYVAAHRTGSIHRELDDFYSIQGSRLEDVLKTCSSKTHKLLTHGDYRKND